MSREGIEPTRQPARTWFDRGCDAFRLTFPKAADKIPYERFYVCPLCLHAFGEEALTGRWLTREHVPPRSVGGHRLALTCRRCNSGSGHEIDSHMRREADIRDFAMGNLGETRAVLATDSGQLPIRLSASGGGIRAVCVPQAASRTAHGAMMEEFGRAAGENTWDGFSLKIAFQPFSTSRAAVGWLRTAYLAFFASLGYRFILRPELAVVRSRIANPESEEPRIFRIIRREKSEAKLVRIDAPDVLRSYAMLYGTNVVLLPLYGDATLYERLAKKPDTTGPLSGVEFRWPRGPMFQHDATVCGVSANRG
jgi:hypothetical protein